ncbi:PREDICTED: methylesterase 10 [Nelumbo nucifera]|uniref:AB hydrolase-1 domain-containing protein n=2 Tax=Nelumbo nucifera TaxID=4432 RepID=A0A822Z6S8_NELNU|nr:PREDICTED: methylesterase 10 [Nelumbo nucifera]DAD40547.1 TPA_asm: hypothetical protein HUJ06_014870 [Nelumbo nucifera]
MGGSKHFVLVHGAGHGAWCWYKLLALLKSAGYRVTALDLGASGVNPKKLDQIASVFEYVLPLMNFMAALPEEERVILVGHSLGGIAISLAMESFSRKISVAVFATAIMPNTASPPAAILQELFGRTPPESLSGINFTLGPRPESLIPTSITFGPEYLAPRMYNCCQPEDVTLGTLLVRPAALFGEDLWNEDTALLSEERYGSVRRVFVVCDGDKVMDESFQWWMIDNYPTKEVKVIRGSDHMVMLSKPLEFYFCLQEIADKY